MIDNIKIKLVESLDDIKQLKDAYFDAAIAPLDGMWHFGFVPTAKHYGIYQDNALIGFYCLNEDDYMLEYCVDKNTSPLENSLFSYIVNNHDQTKPSINGAFVSTAEPYYLSRCLNYTSQFTVNSLMYQMCSKNKTTNHSFNNLITATQDQLPSFVAFAVNTIGAPEVWLKSYYLRLIKRRELFGLWEGNRIISAGESRFFDEYQVEYADLGVIVAQNERNKGIASSVLASLAEHAISLGKRPICSTEATNVGAQRAITNAGFECEHQILKFDFN